MAQLVKRKEAKEKKRLVHTGGTSIYSNTILTPKIKMK